METNRGAKRFSLWIVLAMLFAISSARSEDGDAVCVADQTAATANIAKFHVRSGEDIALSRSISSPQFIADRLDSDAREYLTNRPDHMLLVYAWDDQNVCLLVWENNKQPTYIRHLGGRAALEMAMSNFFPQRDANLNVAKRQAILKRAAGADFEDVNATPNTASPIQTISELSRLIFPVHASLNDATPLGITIMPIGGMATMPLMALQPFGRTKTAAQLFAIHILPTLDDLKKPSLIYAPGFKTVLTIANGTPVDSEFQFVPLPGTIVEAAVIQRKFGGLQMSGTSATKQFYFDHSVSADLIVLATHGVSDPNDPLSGGFLALGDGRLTALEIQNHPLENFPLVVLSACQSGLGQVRDGGTIGVARAFQIAGASNTIMSLWNVNDQSAAVLMEKFYGFLDNYPPAEALRRASLETQLTYPAIADWAAFSVFGPAMAQRN